MAYTLPNEAELLQQLVKGDATAFRSIYDFYQGIVYAFAFRLTKTKELSEDVVQEVFIKIWEKREQINIEKNFGGYIRQMTRNHIYNIWTKAASDRTLMQKIHQHMQELQSLSPDELLEKELARMYRQAIDKLPARQREVYLLRREEELSFAQIAEKLGISTNTVKNQMVSALRSIRKDISGNTDLAVVILAILLHYKQ